MNAITSTRFKNAIRSRTVKIIPLLDVHLPADPGGVAVPAGYISDRNITIGATQYVRKLLSWKGIPQDIKGSVATVDFVLSNVDRALEQAAQLHTFAQATVIFKVFLPDVITAGGTTSEATRIEWVGYVDEVKYDPEKFTLTCKDGFAGLTLSLPRRRFTNNCDLKFDDGLYCPYSGYGNHRAGYGSPEGIPSLVNITTEAAKDFGPNIDGLVIDEETVLEGYLYADGYTSCPKTPDACFARGMQRFYGGMRFVSAWAAGYAGGTWGFNRDRYVSSSSPNNSVFNQPIPMLYGPENYPFVVKPPVFQFRYEPEHYIAAEGVLSLGALVDALQPNAQSDKIRDVLVNGKAPHDGQYSPTLKGISRSCGRIGEPLQWDQIAGDLRQSAHPDQPPVYFSQVSGIFARVQDEDAGSEKADSKDAKGAPDMRVEVNSGRNVWIYASPSSRIRKPSGNPAWVAVSLFLEALDTDYAVIANHAALVNLQKAIDFAEYCDETVTSVVSGSSVKRYQVFSNYTELKPALDHIDAALRDGYGYRYWRNGQLVIAPISACQTDSTPRPSFQEFVNIIDGSFDIKIPKAKVNELHISFTDAAFDYAKNTTTVYSEEHQILNGFGGRRMQLPQSPTLLGTHTADQAQRIGKRWLQDDMGGATQVEWRKFREVELRSTYLMCELEVGDVTYIAHTQVPGGGDFFRITNRTLNDDWTISFSLRSFRVGNYDDTLTGVSSVDLAQFEMNPRIPNSGGIRYQPLPALQWRDGVQTLPARGLKLSWKTYEEAGIADKDKLLGHVFIFRTKTAELFAGGWLGEDCTDDATTWVVGPAPYDYKVGDYYFIGNEVIKIVTAPGGTSITVLRGQEGTNPEPHKKGQQIVSNYFLDKLPDPFTPQEVGMSKTEYIDPWEPT